MKPLVTRQVEGMCQRRRFETSRSSLYCDLLVYWALGDVNADNGGAGFDLTPNNSPTWVGGKIGNAVELNGANQSLSLGGADVGVLHQDGTSGFTVSVWVRPTDVTGNKAVLGICQPIDNKREWFIFNNATASKLMFIVSSDGTYGASSNAQVDALTANNWHHIIAWFDSSTMKAWVQVNGGTPDDGAVIGGINETDPQEPFHVGIWANSVSDWIGKIDEVGFWTRMLTVAERAMLYQSGTGKRFPF